MPAGRSDPRACDASVARRPRRPSRIQPAVDASGPCSHQPTRPWCQNRAKPHTSDLSRCDLVALGEPVQRRKSRGPSKNQQGKMLSVATEWYWVLGVASAGALVAIRVFRRHTDDSSEPRPNCGSNENELRCPRCGSPIRAHAAPCSACQAPIDQEPEAWKWLRSRGGPG